MLCVAPVSALLWQGAGQGPWGWLALPGRGRRWAVRPLLSPCARWTAVQGRAMQRGRAEPGLVCTRQRGPNSFQRRMGQVDRLAACRSIAIYSSIHSYNHSTPVRDAKLPPMFACAPRCPAAPAARLRLSSTRCQRFGENRKRVRAGLNAPTPPASHPHLPARLQQQRRHPGDSGSWRKPRTTAQALPRCGPPPAAAAAAGSLWHGEELWAGKHRHGKHRHAVLLRTAG